MRNIICCTSDYSGLGFALLAQRQGDNVILATRMNDDEEAIDEFEKIGENMIEKVDLDDAVKELSGKGFYWIFDQNHLQEYADRLRAMGEKVFGSTEFTNKMEHDRQFAVDIMEQAGLKSPETIEFTSAEEGMQYLDDNHDRAFVFKPNDSACSYLTFVPSNWDDTRANRELFHYMKGLTEGTDDYVLQERKKGIEINVEAWFYNGKPFFSFLGLENKRKLNRDSGCNVGCSQDVVMVLPLDKPLVTQTIGKLYPYLESIKYTGFMDVNVIYCDNEFYYLESCGRYGYNSHPNLFYSLAKDTFGNIMCDFMDGKVEGFYEKFRKGFGASVSLYTDHPRMGIPFFADERVADKFYHYDCYLDEDGDMLLAGYDKKEGQVGVMCSFGYTIEEAATEAMRIIDVYEELNFPDMAYRSDLNTTDYHTSPIKRHDALGHLFFI